MKQVSCDCPKCRAMCEHSVCLPTPQEAASLLERFPTRMGKYRFDDGREYTAPATVGFEGRVLSNTNMGSCTFHKNGLCELHNNGKPLEGRLAHHDTPWQQVRLHVISTWF